MAIHPGIVRSILSTDLGTDAGVPALVRAALAAAVVESAGRARVSMHPDLWDNLAADLEWRSLHPPGASAEVRRRANGFANLARRIERDLQRLAAHPAYKGRAVLGVERAVLAAWRTESCSRMYPLLRMAKVGCRDTPRAVLLVPSIQSVSGRTLTRWTPETFTAHPMKLAAT